MDSPTFGGGSDPYIVILADPIEIIVEEKSKLKSKMIRHNLNPNWKDEMVVRFRSNDLLGLRDNAHLYLSVWDEDRFNADDLIGLCALPLSKIISTLRRGKHYAHCSVMYDD
jgi:Ca2+-dependent lipid-binding protein